METRQEQSAKENAATCGTVEDTPAYGVLIPQKEEELTMAEQCYAYARRMWNQENPNHHLVEDPDIITGPQLWDNAISCGYNRYTRNAIAKSIVCWDDGGYGHVAWVRSVNSDGTMNISESNWPIGQNPLNRDKVDFADRGATKQFKLLGCVY